jgi:hypothetical protein
MKRNLFITLGLSFVCCILSAQVIPSASRQTIFDELQNPRAGKGSVTIDQPPGIRNLVGARLFGNIETGSDGKSYIMFQGYRVQIYSGNDQRTSKDEAFKREKEIKDMIPDMTTYVTYTAPFWRLRVGDYSSHEEAYYSQRQLMQHFQKYGKEMYIVREDIKMAINDTY